MQNDLKSLIIEKSKELGFVEIGFAKVKSLDMECDYIIEASDKGYFAENQYIKNNVDILRNPQLLIPGAQTVIAVLYNYYTDYKYSGKVNTGKISRYAWGDDYHEALRPKLEQLSDYIKQLAPEAVNYNALDSGKVLEKRWAEYSGIGWQGKNTILINKKYGSWVFIGAIVTTLEIDPSTAHKDLCGDCTLCLDSCPNQALYATRRLDFRKCITHLTVNDKEKVYSDDTKTYGGYIYACDICQNVCPWNSKPVITDDPIFTARNGKTEIDLDEAASMTEAEFTEKYRKSPIRKIKLNGLKFNAEKLKREK